MILYYSTNFREKIICIYKIMRSQLSMNDEFVEFDNNHSKILPLYMNSLLTLIINHSLSNLTFNWLSI